MNHMSEFALRQRDFSQTELRAIGVLVYIQGAAECLGGARRITVFEETLTNTLQQPGIIQFSSGSQRESSACSGEQSRIAKRTRLRFQQPRIFINYPAVAWRYQQRPPESFSRLLQAPADSQIVCRPA